MNVDLLAILADAGPSPAPQTAWRWSLQPLPAGTLILTAALYVRGLDRLWRSIGLDRGVRVWQAQSFIAGLVTIVVALFSPLDRIALALFSAHMVQHLLLMLVAAPLLVLGAPTIPLLLALPRRQRRVLSRWRPLRGLVHDVTRIEVAWIFAVAALWIWHLPPLYQSAVRDQRIHDLEHLTLLMTSLLFWQAVAGRLRRQHGSAAAIGALLTMAAQSSALGIALVFSSPWYSVYRQSAQAWGIAPQTDQQLAGLIMWIPAGAIYLGAALLGLGRLIAEETGPDRSGTSAQAGSRSPARPIRISRAGEELP